MTIDHYDGQCRVVPLGGDRCRRRDLGTIRCRSGAGLGHATAGHGLVTRVAHDLVHFLRFNSSICMRLQNGSMIALMLLEIVKPDQAALGTCSIGAAGAWEAVVSGRSWKSSRAR